ncbi:MAG: 50S ribosomal protein L9 [Clostridia bacterium]|nr:50S ribosomal protein L9 [Clostridia bacterium]
MKVILLADIKGVGKKDDIINANDGYARNYLFPKKLAVEANKGNMTNLDSKKSSEKHRKDLELAHAKEQAEKIKNINLKIQVKAGENGKIFGSLTSKEISDNLKKEYNLDIDKKKINLKEPIKVLGKKVVEIRLYEGVVANLNVEVIG